EELVFRLVEEYFIDCEEIRPLLKKAAKKVTWFPAFYGKRMQDWLDNMGNWCISRKRYWGLPLPFFDCKECGELTVIGTKEELLKVAVEGTDDLPELHRPWIDNVKIKCPKCNALVQKVTEVGDCWLDAGIVPFSTMQYLEDPEYWEKWFPIEAVCEMREQIRLWFYAQLFMSVVLTGKPPYKQVVVHEKVNDKDGREMHKSWGNAIWFSEAVNKIGADVIRWTFAKAPLHQTVNFGYYLEKDVKAFFLTLWHLYSFFATFANLDKFNPNALPKGVKLTETNRPLLDQWLLSQVNLLVKDVRKEMDKANTRKAVLVLEQFVETLSTWYVRRSRRRFWKNENSLEKFSAYTSLYTTLLTVIKLMAPLTPFLSEAIYQNLVRTVDPEAPLSVHLTEYPKVNKKLIDVQLNQEMETLLNAVKLGRATRSNAEIRLRQPLAELRLYCKHATDKEVLLKFKQELLSELNVKKLKFVDNPEKLFELKLKPNYRVLGPVLKSNIENLAEALKQLQQTDIMDAYYHPEQNLVLTIKGMKKPLTLNLMNDLVIEIKEIGSLAVTIGDNLAVALETKLTPELELEGLARDIVRHIQNSRKSEDLQVDNQITVYYHGSDKILAETLTTELRKTTKKTTNKIVILGEELFLSIEKNK
ncbi:MAG: class I tRNA ligase family protein, partial [Candidatus Heimdallarchaeota archaeon]